MAEKKELKMQSTLLAVLLLGNNDIGRILRPKLNASKCTSGY